MRWLLDPEDRRLGQPSRGRKVKGNKRPLVVDDDVVVLPDSGPRIIDVLANDIEPEGDAMTLVSAFAALGTASVTPEGRVSYSPPPGFSGSDTVVYEIADPEDQRDTGQINISIQAGSVQVIETAEETLEIETPGALVDVTLTDPVDLAGTYQVDPFRLSSGPDVMKAPEILGTIEDGETVTAKPGLWAVSSGAVAATRDVQWQVGGADVPGATAQNYLIAAGQAALGIGLRETLSNSFGVRSAISSSGVYAPDQDSSLIGWWDASDTSKITDNSGVVTALAASGGPTDLVCPNGGRRPETGVATIGGLNALSFDGDFAQADVTLPTSGDFALHMVCDIGQVTNPYSALICFDAIADFQLSAAASDSFMGELSMDQIGASFPLTGGPFAGPAIVSILFDLSGAGMAMVFINNVEVGSGPISVPADTTGQIRLFCNRPQSVFVNGLFGELIATQDITARPSIHSYLTAKWGLS